MFANYLSNVEQLLDEEGWEQAVRQAADLPRIAVALAHPALECTASSVGEWCQHWIRRRGTSRPPGAELEALRRAGAELAAPRGGPLVPMDALRRLQWNRHVRVMPRGFRARIDELPATVAERVTLCTALLEAARRWYAGSACHDSTVQANLSRLAVLR